ncbi:xylulose kinase [Alicyclobacillaceae bacterium I2511]|nr:xylulose kinase [Alicyclobacillaceae bacterium I2511]
MLKMYFIGVDCGTNSLRAGLYDQNGNEISFAVRSYDTRFPHPGWAEQDPSDWWEALRGAVRQTVETSHVNNKKIKGITIDGTSCTVVLSDEHGEPLCPALLWMDVRAGKEAQEVTKYGHKYNGGGPVSAEWMVPKMMWVKKNWPEVYNRAGRVMECADWLTYKLTGRWTASLNQATCRWYYDSTSRDGWPLDLYVEFGLADLLNKFPQSVLAMGDEVEVIDTDIAHELGLSSDMVVVQGGADAYVASIGLNALSSKRMAFITGSSHLHILESEKEIHSSGLFGSFPNAVISGHQLLEGGQISTGSILKWFVTQFLNVEKDQVDRLFKDFDQQIENISPGSEGLLVVEHWQGSRTPYPDANARGLVYGLSLSHTPLHVYRAIMEGVAYGTATVIKEFEKVGVTIKDMVVGGGLVNSKPWLEIHASVANRQILIPKVKQAACLGSAILAATGSHYYSTIQEAATEMVDYIEYVDPIQAHAEVYAGKIKEYETLIERIREWRQDNA